LPKAEEIRTLGVSGWRIEFRCGIFVNGTGGGGTTIGSDVVSGIAILHADMGLDIYSDEKEEDGTSRI
jgi:hypothetical protein